VVIEALSRGGTWKDVLDRLPDVELIPMRVDQRKSNG